MLWESSSKPWYCRGERSRAPSVLRGSSGGGGCTQLSPRELGAGPVAQQPFPVRLAGFQRDTGCTGAYHFNGLLQHTRDFLRVAIPYCCGVRVTKLSIAFLLSHKCALFKASPANTLILTILVLAITYRHCAPVLSKKC